jgi:hypothetical protein
MSKSLAQLSCQDLLRLQVTGERTRTSIAADGQRPRAGLVRVAPDDRFMCQTSSEKWMTSRDPVWRCSPRTVGWGASAPAADSHFRRHLRWRCNDGPFVSPPPSGLIRPVERNHYVRAGDDLGDVRLRGARDVHSHPNFTAISGAPLRLSGWRRRRVVA